MKLTMYLFFLSCFFNPLSVFSDDNYAKLFYHLEKNGIIIGQDIDEGELFDLIESESDFEKKGFDYDSLNLKINSLLKAKEKSISKIKTAISKNPDHKINKEVKAYIYDGNERIEVAKNDFGSDNDDSYFTKIINSVLNMMKN